MVGGVGVVVGEQDEESPSDPELDKAWDEHIDKEWEMHMKVLAEGPEQKVKAHSCIITSGTG